MVKIVEDFITGCMCPHCKKCSRSTVMKTALEIDTLEDGYIDRCRKCNRCGETFRTHERVVAPEFRKRREKDLIAEAVEAKQ